VPARRSLLVALCLGAVTLAVYAPSLGNGFVNYDDDLYVTARPEVQSGLSASGLA
jgi:hypothetical protein